MTGLLRLPSYPTAPARRPGLALLAAIALSGCTPAVLPSGTAAPETVRVQPAPAPTTAPVVAAAQPQPSDRVTAHFLRLEQHRLATGLLRQDPAPADLPFTARDLEEIFVRVALYDEYIFENGRVVERATPSTLRRWVGPVQLSLQFGASVPPARRRADTEFVGQYLGRLGNLTGHPIRKASTGANFHVLVLSEEERRNSATDLRRLVPGIDDTTIALVRDLPLSVSCLVLAFSRGGRGIYTDAIAVIRAELPDLSRRACYQEEIAQGLGLPNDSPRARPSLFNDAAEFAVLTRLDEQLLRLLYDRRLRIGIREAEARPIIRQIASELMGGES